MRPSWAAVADAVGHCVLIFTFVPTLAPVPSWIAFELSNPLNARDPVVLAFVLVRGVNLLLDTFRARVVLGVLSGAITGVIVSAWVWSGARVSTTLERIVLGALGGVIGAGLAVTVWPSAAVTLEIISGLLCGMLAAPTAVRFLNASNSPDGAPADLPSL